MSKRVADVLIETLQAAGVERCYGIVGDTLNRIAHAIDRSAIQWVHMRHEEAGAFAAGAEAQLTGRLTACAGSCGPGSLHFINGLYEANRNRAPVILIASQIVRQDLGFELIQDRSGNAAGGTARRMFKRGFEPRSSRPFLASHFAASCGFSGEMVRSTLSILPACPLGMILVAWSL